MGETIIITKHRVPVAQVTPIGTQPAMNWSRDDVSESIAAWRKYRKEHNITLGDDLSIMDLIREGRRG